jgi:hypothetical protein
VRRIGRDAGAAIVMPRVVELENANRFGGADWIGIKRAGASTLLGVESAPLALGPWAMLALLGVVVLAWWREGRG